MTNIIIYQRCGDRDKEAYSFSRCSVYTIPANPMSDRIQRAILVRIKPRQYDHKTQFH